MTTTTDSLESWIDQSGIECEAELIGERPDGRGDSFPTGARHYEITLSNAAGESMTVYFSQGPAVTDWPDAETILDCLANDIASVRAATDKWDWMEQMGGGSKEMEDAWETIHEQARDLGRLTSLEALESLLYDVERR